MLSGAEEDGTMAELKAVGLKKRPAWFVTKQAAFLVLHIENLTGIHN